MKKQLTAAAAFIAAVLGLTCCASGPTTQRDRELLAADVHDLLSAVALAAPEGSRPYVTAAGAVVDAYIRGGQLDWSSAFDAVRDAEPSLRQALLDAGWTPERAEAAILGARILLRRIEAQVAPQPPPAVEANETAGAQLADQGRPHTPIGGITVAPVEPAGVSSHGPDRKMMTDLPRLSAPRIVVNATSPGGTWHWKEGVPRDNFGDGQMTIVRVGDGLEYWSTWRQGTPPPGGVFWRKVYDGNPYEWPEIPKEVRKSLPGAPPYSSRNIDTHVLAQNPLTLLVTWLHGVKPGWNAGANSETFAIQRATATDPKPGDPDSFTRYFHELLVQPNLSAPWERPKQSAAGDWWGGSAESSLTPWRGKMLVFWEAKVTEGPDAFGQRFRGRLGRAECDLATFDTAPDMVRTPPPGPRSYVFDPADDPGYGSTNGTAIWGTAHITLRAHVSVNPLDDSLHMVAINSVPQVRADGEPANGKVNRRQGIGHWWSHDGGFTWRQDRRNPLFDLDSLGWPDVNEGNRLNSPWLMWDVGHGRPATVYLGFWGNPIGAQNKKGTRLYLCEARIG